MDIFCCWVSNVLYSRNQSRTHVLITFYLCGYLICGWQQRFKWSINGLWQSLFKVWEVYKSIEILQSPLIFSLIWLRTWNICSKCCSMFMFSIATNLFFLLRLHRQTNNIKICMCLVKLQYISTVAYMRTNKQTWMLNMLFDWRKKNRHTHYIYTQKQNNTHTLSTQ